MWMQYALMLLLAVSRPVGLNCCSGSLEDDWVITQALQDGIEREEWEGLTLSFESNAHGGGGYAMVDTPFENIWPSRGIWSINTTDDLILDGIPAEEFCAGPGGLLISRWISWPVSSAGSGIDENTIVTGYWQFRFERK